MTIRYESYNIEIWLGEFIAFRIYSVLGYLRILLVQCHGISLLIFISSLQFLTANGAQWPVRVSHFLIRFLRLTATYKKKSSYYLYLLSLILYVFRNHIYKHDKCLKSIFEQDIVLLNIVLWDLFANIHKYVNREKSELVTILSR